MKATLTLTAIFALTLIGCGDPGFRSKEGFESNQIARASLIERMNFFDQELQASSTQAVAIEDYMEIHDEFLTLEEEILDQELYDLLSGMDDMGVELRGIWSSVPGNVINTPVSQLPVVNLPGGGGIITTPPPLQRPKYICKYVPRTARNNCRRKKLVGIEFQRCVASEEARMYADCY